MFKLRISLLFVQRRWICEIPKSETQSWVNHNQHITDKLEVIYIHWQTALMALTPCTHVCLQELLIVYQNSPGDKWRAMSTTKVIQAIKKHPKEITSYEVCIYTCMAMQLEW